MFKLFLNANGLERIEKPHKDMNCIYKILCTGKESPREEYSARKSTNYFPPEFGSPHIYPKMSHHYPTIIPPFPTISHHYIFRISAVSLKQ